MNRETQLVEQLRNARKLQALAFQTRNGRGVRMATREIDIIYAELQKVRKGK